MQQSTQQIHRQYFIPQPEITSRKFFQFCIRHFTNNVLKFLRFKHFIKKDNFNFTKKILNLYDSINLEFS